MFIMGCVVCGLYLTGYLYMMKYANDSHDEDLKRDIEKARRLDMDKENNKEYNSEKIVDHVLTNNNPTDYSFENQANQNRPRGRHRYV